MVTYALLLMMFGEAPLKWETMETEIYRPIVQRESAVNDQGKLFLVNRDQAVILVYNSSGEKIQTIAGRGEGPGELMTPTWLHLMGDKLYVEDAATNSVNVFSTDGKFVSRSRWPDNDLVMRKVTNGWIYGDWESSDEINRPIRLFWADDQFKGARELQSWTRPPANNSVSVRSEGSQKPVVPINPAGEESYITVSPDGKTLYFIRQESADIHIFDVVSGKWGDTIKGNYKPLPFNKDWGNDRVEQIKNGLPENMRNLVDVRPDFPEYFPVVREFSTLSDGTLVMMLWSGMPEKNKPHVAFNHKGQKIKTPFSNEALTRVVAVLGDLCYVTRYDADEEEGRIVCLPTSKVDAFVKSTPVVYNGLPGTAVVVSNRN